MIVAHGNSLRALVKMLDGLSESAIVELNIPTGIPLLYELDDELWRRAPAAIWARRTRCRRPPRRCARRPSSAL